MKQTNQDKPLGPEDFYLEWPRMFEKCMFDLPFGHPWLPVVWNLCEYIDSTTARTPYAVRVGQVKDKFHGLRFYYDMDWAEDYEWNVDEDRKREQFAAMLENIRGAVDFAEWICDDNI